MKTQQSVLVQFKEDIIISLDVARSRHVVVVVVVLDAPPLIKAHTYTILDITIK